MSQRKPQPVPVEECAKHAQLQGEWIDPVNGWRNHLCAKHLDRFLARNRMINAAENAVDSSATDNRAMMKEGQD